MNIKLSDRIENDFSYHPLLPGQQERYEKIREHTKALAHFLVENCPESRELSLALTNLEQVQFFAAASIARNEK